MIGQACEFDYAGCQALKVLRADGFRTVVVNSNPATIMTDPGFADRTYLEPLDLDGVADVLDRERPDALLPTLGGQTALNLALELAEAGVLDELGVELIGAADRRDPPGRGPRALPRDGAPVGLRCRARGSSRALDELAGSALPPSCGRRSRSAATAAASRTRRRARAHRAGLAESPIGQVLVEESLRGWDEFELEVVRDRNDNVVIVCSIENLDPMGVHTGDSVTVAPQMTLSDDAYQELRDAAARSSAPSASSAAAPTSSSRASRETATLRVIEMNPRVSRSSALASKATGYPIAKVAAKLAVGYTLDEIPNDLTGTTPASFEPTLDYVVVKFPRFAFEKFPGADPTLGTQMKSVGEAMGIGRTFVEAYRKAERSRELDGAEKWPLPESAHPWFHDELAHSPAAPAASIDDLAADDFLQRKRAGLPTRTSLSSSTSPRSRAREEAQLRRAAGVSPRRLVRRRGRGGVDLLLLHLGRGGRGAARAARPRSSSSGRARTGSARGSSSTTAASTPLRASGSLGYEAVMVNCNPETVSTDYDTSDRLYFEPLGAGGGARRLRARTAGRRGIQFGGQTPLKLARASRPRVDPRHAVRRRRPRGGPRALRRAARRVGIRCPEWGSRAARRKRHDRPAASASPSSSVRRTSWADGRCASATRRRTSARSSAAVLIDRFVESAIEIDVDAVSDGTETYVGAVMQHVEEAGIHSGDSACVLPAPSLTASEDEEIRRIVARSRGRSAWSAS